VVDNQALFPWRGRQISYDSWCHCEWLHWKQMLEVYVFLLKPLFLYIQSIKNNTIFFFNFSQLLPNYKPVFIDIKTGGLLIPLNHSWALSAGTGAAVSGYKSC